MRGTASLRIQLKRFLKDESGQTTTEYILILAVVVALAIKFKGVFGKKLEGALEKMDGKLTEALE